MIVIYKRDLSNFCEITHALSVQMEDFYNDIGKVTITLPIDKYYSDSIENGGVIYDTVRNMSFIVKNHKYDTDSSTLTVNGYTCNRILNDRVIAEKTKITNVEGGIRAVVESNLRGLPHVELGENNGFQDSVEAILYGGQILDEIMPILESSKMGQRMRWDPDRRMHVFEVYKGRDLTEGIHAVVFSEEYRTANNLILAVDDSVFKNVIYVTGTLKGDSESGIVVEVGTATGGERFERWLDKSIIQDDSEDIDQFRERLTQAGLEEAAKLVRRTTFSVSIVPDDYGAQYRLGDMVCCVSQRFGVELKSRITSVSYTLDANGENVSLTLGEPILTVLGEVKLIG